MTTIIPFIPSNISVPTIPVVLDGNNYNLKITWNVSAQRYYVNVYDTNGNWIITVPLVSTPPARRIQSVIYDPFLNIVVVDMVSPALWPIPLSPEGINTRLGTVIDYTLEGFTPNTYNGKFRSLTLSPTVFSFPMLTDPGPVVITGTVHRLMNMIEPLFTSSLVYRNSAFEINP